MYKKIIIAMLFFAALLVCQFMEGNVYVKHHFLAKKELEKQVINENAEALCQPKVAYLTFDDGPSEVTKTILEILKEKQVKATFFLVGNEITEKREPILKALVKDGHLVGIHTYCHKKREIYRSADAYIFDIQKTYYRIFEVTGVRACNFRFPWGSKNGYIRPFKKELMDQLNNSGFVFHDWNVSGEDSVGNPSEYTILRNVQKDILKFTEPVILLHDSKANKNTASVLPLLIDNIREKGYTFNTLDNRSKPCQYRSR